MDLCSEERNPDQKSVESYTQICSKSCSESYFSYFICFSYLESLFRKLLGGGWMEQVLHKNLTLLTKPEL